MVDPHITEIHLPAGEGQVGKQLESGIEESVTFQTSNTLRRSTESHTSGEQSLTKSGSSRVHRWCSWLSKRREPAIMARIFPPKLSLSESSISEGHGRTWQSRAIRFGPLLGISVAILALLALLASLGNLAGSNHQPVAEWKVSPSVSTAHNCQYVSKVGLIQGIRRI